MTAASGLHVARDGGVVTVTIDLPPHNLVGADFVIGLFGLLPELEVDESVAVVVFRSADPDFFLMHGDVEVILEAEGSPEPIVEPNLAAALFERIHGAPYLTVGVVDGIARGGGCEFLSALDLRVGTERTVVGQPEVALGILPGAGGTVRLARALGRARALEVILSGRDVGADEAMALGWLQALLPAAELDEALAAWLAPLATLDRGAVRAVKSVVDAALAEDPAALVAESAALDAAIAARAHVAPMQRFLAAGGQTRAGEVGSVDALLAAARGRNASS